jgi:ABC-type branched-subunit amino acid transport system substrate-binding protein
MLNANGGINGRRIHFISLDDAYSPAKTVEMTRLLVEKEQVLLIFNPIGSATINAVRSYLNSRGIPQLFVGGGEEKWGDYRHFPWTMGFQQTTRFEGRALGIYLRRNHPAAKVAVLYINDDLGKELLAGLHDGLGQEASRILAATASYDLHDPTVDSQLIALHASGADTLANFAMPKAAAQAIRKAYDIGWKPLQYVNYVSNSVGDVLAAAGLEKSIGVLSADNLKDPSDTQWANDPASLEWRAFMRKYYPDGDVNDSANVYAYNAAQLLEHVLLRCGDDLTRTNVMQQASTIRDLQLPMIIPGVKVNTSRSDYHPLEQLRMMRFDGMRWVPFGNVISP